MYYKCRENRKICNDASHVLEDIRNEEVFLKVSPSCDSIQLYVKSEVQKEVKAGRSLRAKDGLYTGPVGTTVLRRLPFSDLINVLS